MARIAVVGAGVAGLAAAWQLSRAGHAVTVFEAHPRPGGVVHSQRIGGFLVEDGPNTVLQPDPEVATLLDQLGLSERRLDAGSVARRRYVVRRGRPTPLPAGPGQFLRTPLLSFSGKLRLLAEPFAAAPPAEPETIAQFARRRLGPEAAAYLIDPFVAGVYAGRPDALSIRHALPKVWRLERDHGSLFRGAVAALRARSQSGAGPRRGIWSLPEGLGEIPAALARGLAGALRLGVRIGTVRREAEGWAVDAEGAAGGRFDGIVWAAPAHQLQAFSAAAEHQLLRRAGNVPYAPVAVLALGFRRADVAHPLDGFGMLVPTAERRELLGTLFSSSLFPGRAPEGEVLLTSFVGGARSAELAGDDVHAQTTRVLRELRDLLGVTGEPTFRHYVQWPRAIPQYQTDHDDALDALLTLERELPRVRFAGSYRHGVAVGDAIRSGLEAARQLGEDLTAG